MGNESSSRKRFSKKASNTAKTVTRGSLPSYTAAPSKPRGSRKDKSGMARAQSSGAPANGKANGGRTPKEDQRQEQEQQQQERGSRTSEGGDSVVMSQVAENSAKKRMSLDDFVLMTVVGKGSFGKVIQVREKKSGKIFAMKVLQKDHIRKRKQLEHTMAERRILEEIDHPFIVSLRFAWQSKQKLYMVFDYFNGGELFHYLSKGGRFSEERARFYAAEIALGLEHVHAMNIIYRDLKPENLLLDADGHIRITDFGLSKEGVVDDTVRSFCGTPEYLAPEILRRHTYGRSVDWWSLGTLLYEMIAGLPPFYDRNRDRMYKKILGADLRFPAHMAPEARSICRGMLQRNPLDRLGYRGAQEVKSHPFFADIDFEALLTKRVEPPYKPKVSGPEDTSNVDKSFTSMAAAVTPTPRDGALGRSVAAHAAEGDEFANFTFTAGSIFDGDSYRVPCIDEEFEDLVGRKTAGFSATSH